MKRLVQPRSKPQSLRRQLMLTTVVPLIILLIALAVVGVFGFTRLAQTLVEERDAELVQLAAGQIAEYFGDSVLLLAQIASTDAVRNGDVDEMQDLLQADMALRGRFDQLSVTDAQGNVIATIGGELGTYIGELTCFVRARRLRRPVRSPLYQGARGNHLVAVAVPVFDAYGQFAGCTLGVWDLSKTQLGLPIAKIRVGEVGFAYLVNEQGIVLYHPRASVIGTDGRYHPAVTALLKGEAGAQTVSFNAQINVVGYAPISFRQLSSSLFADETWGDWGLLTSELWDDLIEPLLPYARLMALLLFAVVAAPLVLLAFNSHRISAPLESLVQQADRVASGEFDSEVSINTGPSEVRELGEAFNIMVEQLRQYRSDIQNYVVSILNSQERERKRVARELHDETAQALIVLGRQIEMAEEMATGDELPEQLAHLRDAVDATLQGVRRFTRDLRPPLLEELGLSRSLEILVDRLDRNEPFEVDLAIIGAPYPLIPEAELGLYRLAQEGLNNARRHSEATHVDVILSYGPRVVMLEVSDDGIGFDAPRDTKELLRLGRLGIMGMHERARLLGGRAVIESQAGIGTRMRVEIPLSAIVRPSGQP